MTYFKSLQFLLLLSVFTYADFTIVTLPDIQNMTWSPRDQTLYAEMQYIIDKKDELGVKFVVSLGDYTAGGYGSTSGHGQWTIARNSVNMILDADIPYAVCMGNHDMDLVPDHNIPQKMDRFVQYFPVSDFENKSYHGGYFRNMSNNYNLFTADGMDFIILSLQNHQESLFDTEVSDWANGVLTEYSDRRAIIATHMINAGDSYMTNIVEKHDNVFMTVYGHHCADNGERFWTSTTPSGNTIYNLMSDYQCRDNENGGAVIRYYTFRTEDNKIDAFTYSTYRNQFETDASSQFTFDYEMAVSPIPTLSTITQTPDIPEVDGAVTLSATIKDDIGIESATIKWGTSENDMSNSVTLTADGDVYSGSIPGQSLGTSVYYSIEASDGDGNSIVSPMESYTIEKLVYSWNSWDVMLQDAEPQGAVGEGEYKTSIELYESTDDNGIKKSSLFGTYNNNNHREDFNALESYWMGAEDYPYAGKSATPRGGSEPEPAGVFDMQMHPPENSHLVVAAFTAPVDGAYKVSGLGIRRVVDKSGSVALVLKKSDGETVAEITATSQSWAQDSKMYDLGTLAKGESIYFAVDNVEKFNYDACEIMWTVNLFSTEVPADDDVSSSTMDASSNESVSSSEQGPIDISSDDESNETVSSVDEDPKEESSEEQRAALEEAFVSFSDVMHYSSIEKRFYYTHPGQIHALSITGLDGRSKSYGISPSRTYMDLTSVESGLIYLRIETTDGVVVTHSVVIF
ncbi:MAG: metallophosphoesterase [Fibrobacterales bacterium]